MNNVVITVEELAERWKVSKNQIYAQVRNGDLKPIDGPGAIRFSFKYIEIKEEIQEENKTMLEIMQEKEIERLKAQIEELKSTMLLVVGNLSTALSNK